MTPSGELVVRISTSLTLVLTAAVAMEATAQTVDSSAGTVVPARTAILSPAIASGELVRVFAPRARLDGAEATFVRIDSNLVIAGQAPAPDAPARQWSVPVDAVQRLDVWRGPSRSKGRIAAGVVVGALVGAGAGAVLTRFIECGGACDTQGSRKPFASPKLGAFIGAPIGALLGGVVGGMSRKRWSTVTLTIR
jgi:hypothetical protein